MQLIKNIGKGVLYLLLIPLTYLLISLLLTAIPVNQKMGEEVKNHTVYLSTNGVHLNVVLPKENIDPELLSTLKYNYNDNYIGFGWGDENFYLNTPTWGDLTFKNAIIALFLKSSTLMHVTRYQTAGKDWIKVKISELELEKLNTYIYNSFALNQQGDKIILEGKGYSSYDDFYKAKGSYSVFKTSNSWVNTGFKSSGLKACLWTPFDFGLMQKHPGTRKDLPEADRFVRQRRASESNRIKHFKT